MKRPRRELTERQRKYLAAGSIAVFLLFFASKLSEKNLFQLFVFYIRRGIGGAAAFRIVFPGRQSVVPL